MAANIRAASPLPSPISPNPDVEMRNLTENFKNSPNRYKFVDELRKAKESIKSSSSRRTANSSSDDNDWKNPTVVELRGMLLKYLGLSIEGAIKKIAESGNSKEEAVWAVSNINQYNIGAIADLEACIVKSAEEPLKSKSENLSASGNFSAMSLMEMLVNEARKIVPHFSIAEAISYMLIFDCNLDILKLADRLLKREKERGEDILVEEEKRKDDWEAWVKYVIEFAGDDAKQYWANWAIEKVKEKLKRDEEDLEKLKNGTKEEQEETAKKMAEQERLMSLATAMEIGRLMTEDWEQVLSVEDMKKDFDTKKEFIKQYRMRDELYLQRLKEKQKTENSPAKTPQDLKAEKRKNKKLVKNSLKKVAELQAQISPLLTETATIQAGTAESKASSSKTQKEEQKIEKSFAEEPKDLKAEAPDDLDLVKDSLKEAAELHAQIMQLWIADSKDSSSKALEEKEKIEKSVATEPKDLKAEKLNNEYVPGDALKAGLELQAQISQLLIDTAAIKAGFADSKDSSSKTLKEKEKIEQKDLKAEKLNNENVVKDSLKEVTELQAQTSQLSVETAPIKAGTADYKDSSSKTLKEKEKIEQKDLKAEKQNNEYVVKDSLKEVAELQAQTSQLSIETAPIKAGIEDSKDSSSETLPAVEQVNDPDRYKGILSTTGESLVGLKPCGHLVSVNYSDNETECPRCQTTITGRSRARVSDTSFIG